MNYSRGSEWRKWDLHLHTPFTKLNDQFSSEEEVWKTYCEKIEKSDVEVFAITDYFCVDNYFTFIEKYKTYFPNSKKVFFSNIEFRLEVSVNKKGEEVNIHVIFSDKVAKAKIEEFLSKLNTNITRSGAKVSCRGLDEREFESAGIDYVELKEKLKEVFGNERCYVIIAAANNAGLRPDTQSPRKLNITDEVDKICDGFFGGQQNVNYYLGTARYETAEESKPKPVVCGCDAHSFNDLDNFLGKRSVRNSQNGEEIVKDILWVKAEPIFEGLLQVFNEPARTYIGTIPPVLSRVTNNPTKYIKSISISKVSGSKLNDLWFDNFNVNLNYELVAIIGNKGKGKSALADILGLCANAHIDEDDFSFLNKTKFRHPRPNIAREFSATLNWMGGTPDVVNLDSLSKPDSPEKVKYIPQSFLEKLCTSIDKKIFEAELEKVIFSRLESYQKLGKGTLAEILNEKKSTLINEIARIKNEIGIVNISIIELDWKNSENYRKSIAESLLSKQNELNVHEVNKPIKVELPNENEESKLKTQEITNKIKEYRTAISDCHSQIDSLNSERERLALEINEISQSIQGLNALSVQIGNTGKNYEALFVKYNLKKDDILNYSVNVNPLQELLSERNNRLKEIGIIFHSENQANPVNLIAQHESRIIQMQEELDGQSKLYQQYITQEQEWLKIKDQITGSAEKEGTVIYCQFLQDYLDKNIQKDIDRLYDDRRRLLLELLKVKVSIAELYKELYKPVTDFINQNKNELSDYNVNIDVALETNGFENKFFSFISNGVTGSFCGGTESRQMLNQFTDVVDFNNIDEVARWIEQIIHHLQIDKREGQLQNTKRELKSQLKSGFKEKDFYDFLFGADYYEPNYQLKLGDKKLSELSPGERGALLLIFYLLLDKQDIPIIIDQPEENLDNQSVYKILVHFIKKAKLRRQIIIVTHNPNLAVVCDAEQIIRMDIAKEGRNLVSMITGGIEDPQVNRAIVDILEGTRPAFNNRTDKYELTNLFR